MTTETDIYVLDPAGQAIYTEIENVRAIGPVARVELPGGLPAWMVTDYAAIKTLLTHPMVSKDAALHWGDLAAGKVPQNWPLMPWVGKAGMFTAYGADHRRLRRIASPAFTQHRTDQLRPMVQKSVADALEQISLDHPAAANASRPTSLDLRERFCFPIPIAAIGGLLGVDDDLFPVIKAGADALFDTSVTPEELGARFMGLLGGIEELVRRKTEHPDDSLTSALIQANADGDRYTPEEIAETVRVVIVAGYETTVNLLDQAIFNLLTHPQHLAAVQDGRITWDDVVDETLRCTSPAANVPLRFAVEDIEVAGTTIRKGEAILTSFAGAGRDPEVHGQPGTFDPGRENKDHLGFGYGAHRCLGAPLAALEATVALPMLFDRYPHMVLAEDPATIPANPGFITNGHQRLLVNLSPTD